MFYVIKVYFHTMQDNTILINNVIQGIKRNNIHKYKEYKETQDKNEQKIM